MPANEDTALLDYVLRFGDNALVLGQRLGEWAGHGPILEEDLALTNVALDLVGQARLWLAYAAEICADGRDADRLAFFRDQREYRNVLLVERPNGNYADTTARQFFFDAWHVYVLQALSASTDARIAAIASKSAREAAYHVRRSGEWVVRLGDGTPLSRERMQTALDAAWPYTGELFTADGIDREMLERGIGCDLDVLQTSWHAHVARIVARATLVLPEGGWMHAGGKIGRHSEALSYLLAEMQSVARSIPAERW